MRFRRWQTFISLVALCAAAPVVRAQAQPQREPSHVPIGSFENRSDAARLFSERLQKLRSIRQVEWSDKEKARIRELLQDRRLQSLHDPKALQKLLEDPDVRQLVRKWRSDPAAVERLKRESDDFRRFSEFAKRSPEQQPSPSSSPPSDTGPNATEKKEP